jgi:filamentous hemagglutinin
MNQPTASDLNHPGGETDSRNSHETDRQNPSSRRRRPTASRTASASQTKAEELTNCAKPSRRNSRPTANNLYQLAAVVGVCFSFAAGLTAQAGDILRGGAPAGLPGTRAPIGGRGVNAARTSANAGDALARTTQALQAVKAMQNAARNLATRGPNSLGMNPNQPGVRLPSVPNGLAVGGLKVSPYVPTTLPAGGIPGLWSGAQLPKQTQAGGQTIVTIKQEQSKALLTWESFNIGKETTLKFDQSAGGSDKGKWIAFNKVEDPTGVPSQILGSIEAPGQVYVINRNGIIFGGSSQVNTRGFVASTLPINDNLIGQGLLNNPDAQFLFSALPVPGGSDGTPAFLPTISDPKFQLATGTDAYLLAETLAVDGTNNALRAPLFVVENADGSRTTLTAGATADYTLAIDPASKRATATFTAAGLAKIGAASVKVTYTPEVVKSGNVTLQPGAVIKTPVSADGNGGRVMLVGANVTNAGTISTPSGQTIIAAGQQVGIAAHDSNDPSLRGLDVWVGAAGEGTGSATNQGLIKSMTGSVAMHGRNVNQFGAIESSTSVNLNGRIDLRASYGAVANPNFDVNGGSGGGGGPVFLYQHTGVVKFGENSVTRILPDYLSEDTVPGLTLPEKSQINVEGRAIHFGPNALTLAPNADVSIRAGDWFFTDTNGDRTIFGSDGNPEPGLARNYTGTKQRLLFSTGQIYLDASSMINVAGSTDVFVPLTQSILDVEFRGAEFADSPLQRNGAVQASSLTLDLRQTGIYSGRFWMGTPLGDATGLAGLIQRNAAQLTAEGGTVSLQAGESIVMQKGATIDVSGGYYRHEAGMVTTSRLLQFGRLVEAANALPNTVYEGIYTGKFSQTSARWGVTETFAVPWMTGAHFEESYISGADGGVLNMTAPSMAIDGKLLGLTVEGPRQRSAPADYSTLSIAFKGEQLGEQIHPDLKDTFVSVSPTPPSITFQPNVSQPAAEPFKLTDAGDPLPIREERIKKFVISSEIFDQNGFGNLSIENPNGDIRIPGGVSLDLPAHGSLTLDGSNISVLGHVTAPSGSLSFTVHNISLEATQLLSVQIETRTISELPLPNPDRGLFTLGSGASLSTAGLMVNDLPGSANPFSQPLAVDGGTITIDSYDANLAKGSSIDVSGGLAVSSRGALGYGNGGNIIIRAGRDPGLKQLIGGDLSLHSTLSGYSGNKGGTLAIQASVIQIGGATASAEALLLSPDFFRHGGFTSYSLTGIGGAGGIPGVNIAPGTIIRPVAESLVAVPHTESAEFSLERRLTTVGYRLPVSLSFNALGFDNPFTTDVVDIVGNVKLSEDARVVTDPGASVSFKGQTVTLLGTANAPGGTISVTGADKYPIPPNTVAPFAQATVYIGPDATLSTAGTAVIVPDEFGHRLGKLYPGGTIAVSGNIIAEAGAILDVSGSSAVFDLHPSVLGVTDTPIVPTSSGLTTPLWSLQSVPTRMDSNGGLLDIRGSEMLFTDATLLGAAGGPTAHGGTLSVASNRFAPVSAADINLIVIAKGNTIASANTNLGVGSGVLDASGTQIPGIGFFAANRFTNGGFDSLDLGYKFYPGFPISLGGNVKFEGPVSISARGSLRIASGGIVQANAPVSLTAGYALIGQAFLPPVNPNDSEIPPFTGAGGPQAVAPTFGPGSLSINANMIDIGTVSLQGIGRAKFVADGGDIRGNGTINIAGDLTLRAAQVYPTTLSTFSIFAYDHDGVAGSVTVVGSGHSALPLSAGGSLNIFASTITQGGVLRAPMGSITLGWDGTDLDPSDPDLDSPFDPVARGSVPVPVSDQVTLKSGSRTSVAAVGMLIPFGLSTDGSTWIDPSGVNVTVGGLPKKEVIISGDSVTKQRGSTVDLRGGGDLYAFRWIPGPGGSSDLLGAASVPWSATAEYQAGDLVKFGGKTWSARVRHSGESPSIGLFWSQIPESYAVLPGYNSIVAPYAPFNNGPNSISLGGDSGFVSNTLHVGDRIYLSGIPGLSTGTYTLLPSRYALLPGAFLVTPTGKNSIGTFNLPDGASFTSGIAFNQFSHGQEVSPVRAQYEVAPFDVVHNRVEFDNYIGNSFFTEAAARLNVKQRQQLPMDGGHLALHGNEALDIAGQVLAGHPSTGRGAAVDISSFADIEVIGGSGTAPAGATAVLKTSILNSWNAASLLIGGLRHEGNGGTTVEVRANDVHLSNAGTTLIGSDITLAAKTELIIGDGSAIASTGRASQGSGPLLLSGGGALVRVSADPRAAIIRTNRTESPTVMPSLSIGADAQIAGRGVILDSTHLTQLDPTAGLDAQALTIGSGRISIQLPGSTADLSSAQYLVLTGQALQDVQQVRSLTLTSYSTIDIYGAGEFGSDTLNNLSLQSAGIVRGNDSATGDAVFHANNILFTNPSKVAQPISAPAVTPGTLKFDADVIRFGANNFSIAGYGNVVLNASGGILSQGKTNGTKQVPTFSTAGSLTMIAPTITGVGGSSQNITAGGTLTLEQATTEATVHGGLGSALTFTGAEIVANSDVVLPSGQITLHATTGDVTVAGKLDVSGTKREFYNLIRYTSGGNVTLTADLGNVTLGAGSNVSVAAFSEEGNTVTGNAGTFAVNAAKGAFNLDAGAVLHGRAGAGRTSGGFVLDTGSLPGFTTLASALNDGGFFQQRSLRVRTGDVLIDGTNAAHNFTVSADTGNIHVAGTIDASWKAGLSDADAALIKAKDRTGGSITLVAHGDLVVQSGALLTVHAQEFSSAGKGGQVRLEAGAAVNGDPNLGATLDLQNGATINLGVDKFVAGTDASIPDYMEPGSSAFRGQFTGTLHLRAPRNGNDVNVGPLLANIQGASSVLVEGFKVYNATNLDVPLRNLIHNEATDYMNAGYAAMQTKLLTGSVDPTGLDSVLVIAPGVEIINKTGNLELGATNSLNTADWDLSGFRYGPKQAAGVLTLRAAGDLVFHNALSDGFTPVAATAQNGHSTLWLAQLMNINANLPVNTQSWSYRLAAGSDFAAADFRDVIKDTGSLLLGDFYAPIPNTSTLNAIGDNGLTANTIRISTDNTNRGTRYEVIRTGTGDIDIAAGLDVQLRNQFATIYTAGVRLPTPTTIFAPNDFVTPTIPANHVSQGPLGAIQQLHVPQWSMAGGDVTISAGGDIRRVTLLDGVLVDDSSRQLPNNWLYRRGYVDPATGLFGTIRVTGGITPVVDSAASTAWWIDFTNFFEGVGALGGGDVTLLAGHDVINVDAVVPTNARMPSRDANGIAIAPDRNKLVEFGGGDLVVRAGNNIDGGAYYVERGSGLLFAGGEITTNAARTTSLGILGDTDLTLPGIQPAVSDPTTWLPTTLFVGKSSFDVSARGDILLGPVTNPFMMPQGLNNKFWYKTYFNTYSEDAGATVASLGGSVTHRLAVGNAPILQQWLDTQNRLFGNTRSSYYQPWIRLAETSPALFQALLTVNAPNLSSTTFAGDLRVVGPMTLFPSPTGDLKLAASGSIIGLNPSAVTVRLNTPNTDWTAATINVSDANPALIPGVMTPLSFLQIIPTQSASVLRLTNQDVLDPISLFFQETGSYSGFAASAKVQQTLHTEGLLHAGDDEPIRIYAGNGDITGLTLFAPKATQIAARRDITDVSLYIQHVANTDISFVSAGRDIIPFNANAPLRSLANDITAGNFVVDPLNPLAGDIQINGPGVLEVLAGRNMDLGAGSNLADGTGTGITSVGNARNPYLPFEGADLIVMAGVSGVGGHSPAFGLSGSSLNFNAFIDKYLSDASNLKSSYLSKLGSKVKFDDLSAEQQAIVALDTFYGILREAGRAAISGGAAAGDSGGSDGATAGTGTADTAASSGTSNTAAYDSGFAAIDMLFGSAQRDGDILTQSREIRTRTGGAISLMAPGGGVKMASNIFGNPLTPPGVVTEFGGAVNVFTDGSVDIGQARIFTLRGGDITIWSSNGDIAAGNAPKTVVSAPPTRVVIDVNSATVQTDLGGLATGGGIGVLAAVEGVPPGNVDLIAPNGLVDAGDAGIRVTGNLNIAATVVLNASNIQSGGTSSGVPTAVVVSAPPITALAAGSSAAGAANAAASQVAQPRKDKDEEEEKESIVVVEVIGYGGGEGAAP